MTSFETTQPQLGTATVRLREIAREDLPAINRWRADRETVDGLGGPFRYVGLEVDAAWLNSYLSNRNGNVRLAICLPDKQEPVGVVYLLAIDTLIKSCEFAIMIGDPTARGRSLGFAATKMALRHAFFDLNLNRVFLHVLAENEAALKLYRRIGFVEEGRLRAAAYKNGEYRDLLVMSILRSEFDKN